MPKRHDTLSLEIEQTSLAFHSGRRRNAARCTERASNPAGLATHACRYTDDTTQKRSRQRGLADHSLSPADPGGRLHEASQSQSQGQSRCRTHGPTGRCGHPHSYSAWHAPAADWSNPTPSSSWANDAMDWDREGHGSAPSASASTALAPSSQSPAFAVDEPNV